VSSQIISTTQMQKRSNNRHFVSELVNPILKQVNLNHLIRKLKEYLWQKPTYPFPAQFGGRRRRDKKINKQTMFCRKFDDFD